MRRIVYNEENWKCPKCGDMLNRDIDIGDNCLYDVCLGCGFKRKKKVDGQVINEKREEDIKTER